MKRMPYCFLALSIGIGNVIASTTWAASVHIKSDGANFEDARFDPADYSVETHQTGGATITLSQIQAGGNPGQALDVSTIVPDDQGRGFSSAEYYLYPSFSYDPAQMGAISSLDFKLDTYTQASPGFNYTANAGVSLIAQGGEFYAHVIDLPAQQGIFLIASASNLKSTDYSLVTDRTIFLTDATKHPNFSAGTLQFGFITGWFTLPGTPANTSEERIDNLAISILAVPEPCGYIAILAGLAYGFWIFRNRAKR
jgi:hypothetical protein